jgi:hypothetical protein
MAVSIATHENGPYPRRVTVTLSCDAATDLFCRGFEDFTSPDGFIACHREAISKGWLERQASQGRVWLCPQCSGKQ